MFTFFHFLHGDGMMNKQKNGGFTLIELMVVIVITGILAAVAVPKLFGHLAKAKASEVYSSAGTYIALQDAFNTEYQESIGSWKKIGYIMPSSTTFKFYEGNSEGGNTGANTVSVSSGEEAAWKAVSIVPLNDCNEGSAWQIDVVAAPATAAYHLDYHVKVSGGANGPCDILTRHFGALSTVNNVVDPL